MKKIKKTRKESQVSMIAGILAMLMIPIIFIFALMPMYGLAGSELNASAADKKLDSLVAISIIFGGLLILFVVMSISFGLIGAYKDAKAKTKNKS